MSATLTLPENVRCNGRQDFGEGRTVLLCFTDLANGGDFYVTETNATTEIIAGALKKHRNRMNAKVESPGFMPSRSQVIATVLSTRLTYETDT